MNKGKFSSVAEKRAYLRAKKRERKLMKHLLGDLRADGIAYAEQSKKSLIRSVSSGGLCSPR
jgi:hypothetical protein